MKYEKIGETEVVINTLPQKQQAEAEVWQDCLHEFSLTPGDIKEGQFKLSVSPSLTCIPPLGISAIVMKEMKEKNIKDEIKVGDTYLRYKTLDTYLVDESEKENTELIYEIVVGAINNFNSLLDKHPTTFRLGRYYKILQKDEVVNEVKRQLGISS